MKSIAAWFSLVICHVTQQTTKWIRDIVRLGVCFICKHLRITLISLARAYLLTRMKSISRLFSVAHLRKRRLCTMADTRIQLAFLASARLLSIEVIAPLSFGFLAKINRWSWYQHRQNGRKFLPDLNVTKHRLSLSLCHANTSYRIWHLAYLQLRYLSAASLCCNIVKFKLTARYISYVDISSHFETRLQYSRIILVI